MGNEPICSTKCCFKPSNSEAILSQKESQIFITAAFFSFSVEKILSIKFLTGLEAINIEPKCSHKYNCQDRATEFTRSQSIDAQKTFAALTFWLSEATASLPCDTSQPFLGRMLRPPIPLVRLPAFPSATPSVLSSARGEPGLGIGV